LLLVHSFVCRRQLWRRSTQEFLLLVGLNNLLRLRHQSRRDNRVLVFGRFRGYGSHTIGRQDARNTTRAQQELDLGFAAGVGGQGRRYRRRSTRPGTIIIIVSVVHATVFINMQPSACSRFVGSAALLAVVLFLPLLSLLRECQFCLVPRRAQQRDGQRGQIDVIMKDLLLAHAEQEDVALVEAGHATVRGQR
jgi:hypothetical protein